MAQLVQMIYDSYRDLMDNKSDPRVNDWLMMSSPFPTLALCLFYAYFVKVLGPKLMENQKPFDLRRVMIWYNLIQVIFSTWLFNEVSCQESLMQTYRDTLYIFLMFAEFGWLGRTILLQVSAGRLFKRSDGVAYGKGLLVVLLLKVHRIHRHDLFRVEKKERPHYHLARHPSRLHAHICLVRS